MPDGVIQVDGVGEKQVPPPEGPAPKRLFSRPGQVDRGRRTPREEERLGAPGSASATPARQRDRQRPPHADQCRAKVVRKTFDARTVISSVVPSGFLAPDSMGTGWADSDGRNHHGPACLDWRKRLKSWL
jgi:hypothetical protein